MKMKPKFILFPMALFLLLACASCSFADQIEEALYVKTLYVNGTLVTPIGAMNTTGNTSSNLVFSESPTIANVTLTGDVTIANKTYGELYLSETGVNKATSIAVVDGTITAGDVTKTYFANQEYLTIQETGAFKINATFTGLIGNPYKIVIVGRYEGNPAHAVEAEIYNYTSGAFDNMVATTKDFPYSLTDALYQFTYPAASANYISGGTSIFRFDHTSSATTTHFIYIDKIELLQCSLTLPTAGTFYTLGGMTVGLNSGVTCNATSMVITKNGTYSIDETASWGGTPNAVYYGHIFVNGVAKESFGVRERLNASGDMMTSTMSGLLNLVVGDVITIRFTSDNNNSCMSIQYLNLHIELV